MQTINSLTSPTTEADPTESLPLADATFDPSSTPFVSKVANSEVPGVTFTLADLKSPEVAPVVANSRALLKVGLGVYTNPKKGIAALFNPEVITLEELKKVDAAGKLDQILVPYSKLSGAGPAKVAPESTAPPTQMAGAPVSPLSRGAQTAAAKSRLTPASKQKAPGGGSLLNSLLA